MDLCIVPEYLLTNSLIIGCGNRLIGDDGFGPEVIKALQDKNLETLIGNNNIGSNTNSDSKLFYLLDAGTSVREVLFNIMLSDIKPKSIFIIDGVDKGRKPGETFEISIEEIPENKIDDFSFHQMPTSNLLKELKDLCKIKVIILACQVETIPDMVKPGLSKTLQDAVPKMCELVIKKLKEEVAK